MRSRRSGGPSKPSKAATPAVGRQLRGTAPGERGFTTP
ncbi:hypothetical protein ATKI12_1465 [Kitasatospora sp. Ki12]